MRPNDYSLAVPSALSVAVIGGGIAGMAAAHALSAGCRVTLFEAAPRLGGHARTVMAGPRRDIAVDTGFLVFNRKTYPNLGALFDQLDVPVKPADMSFAVSLDDGAFEYGVSDPWRVFADPTNAARPRFWRMLSDILRFNREALAAASDPAMTLDELLGALRLSSDFRDRYLYPLAGAIWSTGRDDMGTFPARTLVRFFDNHCLLSALRDPGWLTIDGGSAEYVQRLERALRFRRVELRSGAPVRAAGRSPQPWVRADGAEREHYDALVFACHSDQALRLLADPSVEERAILSALRYRPNRAVLHGDLRHMPRRRAAWSSWVYRGRSDAPERTGAFTYWMNQLQGLDRATPLFVSLNPAGDIDETLIYDETVFEHPQFDMAALAAQRRLPEIQGGRGAWFAGAWTGHGFHEDGMVSGLEAARAVTQAASAPDRVCA